jgi:hypothetical protein
VNTLPKPQGQIYGNSFRLTAEFSINIPGLGCLTLLPPWQGEASIPQWGWSLIGYAPLSEEVLVAGLVHDWLYRTRSVDRSSADDYYFVLALLGGCSHRNAELQYKMLRWFGWWAWRRVTEAQICESLALGRLVVG